MLAFEEKKPEFRPMAFILIDRLLSLQETQVVAEKIFKIEDPIFLDHFPGSPIVPGSLLLEGMAQSCGWWITWKNSGRSKSALLMAEGLQFRHFVRPGEIIRYEAKVLLSGEGRTRFQARAFVDSKMVAKGELSFAVFAIDDSAGPFQAETLGGWIDETFQRLQGPAAAEKSV